MTALFSAPPIAPVNVIIVNTTNTSAVITVVAPVDTDGLPVHNYIVYYNSTGREQSRTVSGDNSTSITIQDLLPALNYTVVVAAVTRRLERLFKGKLSDSVMLTTLNGSK